MFDLSGVGWEFSDNLFQMLQNFTCRIYSSRPGTNSINELRYRLFCSKRCNIESDQLPPCADWLYKHACQANQQTEMWRRRIENCPEIPSPLRHEWIQDENKLGIYWMSGHPAPATVLQLLSCSCTKSCIGSRTIAALRMVLSAQTSAGSPIVTTGEKNKLSQQKTMLTRTRICGLILFFSIISFGCRHDK